jgi:hypothetical protein
MVNRALIVTTALSLVGCAGSASPDSDLVATSRPADGPPASSLLSDRPTTSSVAAADRAFGLCFPTMPDTGRRMAVLNTGTDDVVPVGLPDLVVVDRRGDVWLIPSAGTGTSPSLAGSGYAWAEFGPGGSIYASRITPDEIVIDRLGVRGAERMLELPYDISPSAPNGFCGLDGYLAQFAIGANRLILMKHSPGPVPHSCPAELPSRSTTTTDPWRCQSPETVSPEVRDLSHPAVLGHSDSGYGRYEVAAGAAESDAMVVYGGGSATVDVGRRHGSGPRFLDGALSGRAFSMSPAGDEVVYSPDGLRVVRSAVTDLERSRNVFALRHNVAATAAGRSWVAAVDGEHVTVGDAGERNPEPIVLSWITFDGIASIDLAPSVPDAEAAAVAVCQPYVVEYGPEAELVAAFPTEGQFRATCWINGEIPKSPPLGLDGDLQPRFDRVVLGIDGNGIATVLQAGYRESLPIVAP